MTISEAPAGAAASPPTLAECLARRRNDLAAVRILAATAVLWAHAWSVTTPGLKTADYVHVFGFSPDFHGVHAFFVLSGMLLAHSLRIRPDPLRFVVARLMRYVPAILVAALVAAFVVGPLVTRIGLADYFASGRPFAFVLETITLLDVTATLPGVFDLGAQHGILFVPLWTIHYELVFAIALAAVWATGLLRLKPLVLAGLAFLLAINVVWFWGGGEANADLGSPHHAVRFASTFGIGVALALFAERIPVSNRILLAIAAVAAPLAFTPLAPLAGMVLIAYGILCVGFAGGGPTAFLARLGVWSYGFYVWSFLIEQAIAWAAPGLSAWAVWGIAFAIALLVGRLSWLYVERPAMAWTDAITAAIRGRSPGRASAPAARD